MIKSTGILTDGEKQAAFAIGVLMKSSSIGITPNKLKKLLIKQAGSVGTLMKFITAAPIAASILLGVPIGVGTHILHKKYINDTPEINKLKRQKEYYRALAKELEQELSYENNSYE